MMPATAAVTSPGAVRSIVGAVPIIMPWQGIHPSIDPTAFIAPGAVIIGDTIIGPEASVWFCCVLRGDQDQPIRVGARTNIQDGTIVHVNSGLGGAHIGDDVTIGHQAIIHACRVETRAFIGMGACILDGAVVETDAVVAARAVVTPGKRVPSGELWAGSPAKKMRDLSPQDLAGFRDAGIQYRALAAGYRAMNPDAPRQSQA
jgi:carbonic anhydrase/acetyltransferase-like protein (isoleucine patch superfamily)